MPRKKKENTQPETEKPSLQKEVKTAKLQPKPVKKPARSVKKEKIPTKTAPKPKSQKSAKSGKTEKAKTPGKKPRARRKAHATRPTKAEEILIIERRQRVYELKRNGMSVREICSRLQSEGHKSCSTGTVHADLTAMLDEARNELALDNAQWLSLMIDRNEDQYFRVRTLIYQNVTIDDPNSKKQITVKQEIFDPEKENLLQRNQMFLDRLVGASKSEQSKNKAAEALAALMGVSPDELGEPESDDG